jgi:hypothetical protein
VLLVAPGYATAARRMRRIAAGEPPR